jgi:transposase
VIQIAPPMRILVAIEAVDGRKGIDSLARLCQEEVAGGSLLGMLVCVPQLAGKCVEKLL